MTATGVDFTNSLAILLGTSVYSDEEWVNGPAVVNSLHGMRSALTEPRLGGWPTNRIDYWLDRTNAQDVALDLRRLARSTRDVLIFYFAGHGTLSSRSKLCLLLPDSLSRSKTGLAGDLLVFPCVRRRARIR